MDINFENKAMFPNGMYNLSPLQAYKLCQEGAIIVDVREEYLNRFKIFDVPKLIFCPLKKLDELLVKLPNDKLLIFADASGIHSPKAVKLLKEHEFKGKYVNLSGGLVDWEHSGLPVLINYDERVSGKYVYQLKPKQQGESNKE